MSCKCHIEVRKRGDLLAVRLLDRRLAGHQEVEEAARECNCVAAQTDCREVLLDCSNLSFLSSEMLSKLIVLDRQLKRKNVHLALCGVRPEIRHLLGVVKLDRLFDIRETQRQAAMTSA